MICFNPADASFNCTGACVYAFTFAAYSAVLDAYFSALSAKSETLASEVFSSGSFAATTVASFEILSVTVVIPAVSVPIPVSSSPIADI